jgi:hypothetical protein
MRVTMPKLITVLEQNRVRDALSGPVKHSNVLKILYSQQAGITAPIAP